MLKYFYKVIDDKVLKGSGYKIINGYTEYDHNDIPEIIINFDLKNDKDKLLKDIQSLADYWSIEIKNYVSGKKLTSEQIERYNYKYEVALDCKTNDDYSIFDSEASDLDMTSSDLVDLIIQAHDDWLSTIKTNSIRIEYFRIAFNNRVYLIENVDDVPLFDYKLSYAKKSFNMETTDDDVKALLDLTEIPQ
jgi:hypothetical protein